MAVCLLLSAHCAVIFAIAQLSCSSQVLSGPCQELSEQAPHEGSDDVAEKPPNHWMINDLVLFVDSEDTPRIPKQLFDEVTQIRVAGVPGPVYRGHIEAFRQLVKIILFILLVFVVVLSFGTVYEVKL